MASDFDITETLRNWLVGGRFMHGTKLKADALKAELGCSASTVREALFRLSLEGLVTFQDQRGFRVPHADPEILHDITQMRIWLEEQGACLSLRRSSVAWEARLTAAHHKISHIESRLERAEASDAVFQLWIQGEQEFHQTLVSNCGSELLKQTHLTMYRRFRQQMVMADRDFKHLTINRDDHQGILDAVLKHDEDALRTRIRAHLSRHLATSERAAVISDPV